LASADAYIISSPEYAHGIPGVLKNALDWLVSCDELVGKPVAVFNASAAGGEFAARALVEVLTTMSWKVSRAGSLMEPFLPRKLAAEAPFDESVKEPLRKALLALAAEAVTSD
jgi:NAD(P)H-dependent FMN reductase